MSEKAIYRIIDANFNRAREALRVMEEYGRFALNHPGLSARAKELRHQLCQAIEQLPPARLLNSRDSIGDVGAETQVPGQHQRRSLEDCLTAGCKRLSEALRALTETMQTLDPALAQTIERLRFQGYNLEKDLAILGIPRTHFQAVRLYVLISSNETNEIRRLTEQCIAGGADCLQLRTKGLSDREQLDRARGFVSLCRDHGVLSIINDRVDIAVAAGAGGVHLGADDLSVAAARQLQTEPLVIGVTTHNVTELQNALAEQPTYVALGPAFPTTTKPGLKAAGLEYIKEGMKILENSGTGHVVIGGVTPANLDQILETGARTVAVCAAVTATANPQTACEKFQGLLSVEI